MGSATSSIPTEPIVAAAVAAGAVGYGYVHYFRPIAPSGDEDAYSDTSAGASKATSTLRGQKKRGRKLQLPGDATLKNLDVLDAPVPGSLSVSTSASKTRERQRQPAPPQQEQQREAPAASAQSRDVVPGGFDGAVTSVDDARDTPQGQSQSPLEPQQVQQQQQQHVSVGATKKPKKKKGKKAAVPSDPSSTSAVGASPSLATPASATAAAVDGHDERWTRVEARKKKVAAQSQDGLAELHSAEATAADVTTSDAGVTTSVTGNSSPTTERTTEDGSEPDESAPGVSVSSSQDAQRSIVPVRPPPGEKPAKGFTWEDYEGVQVDEDASDEDDGGWGVVRSRRRPNKAALEGGEATTTATTTDGSSSQPQTKKQRQNAQRREALKEVKREREAQQQSAFVTHKRELERARAAEPVPATTKRTGSRYDSLG